MWKKQYLINVNSILTKAWYQDRKSSQGEEAENIIKTATK